MKQAYTQNKAIVKFLCFAIFTLFIGVKSANACHGVALVNLVTTNTGTSMTLDGNSDVATCGCGPYYVEVEVTCQPTFQGTPPIWSSATWNTPGQPYYHSILNIPGYSAPAWTDQCALEPYTQLVIPFADLCPGTLYHWRYREFPATGTASPWFPLTDFTTPGSPPASILIATSELLSSGNPQYSGCPGDLFQLDASVSGGCPGATYAFQWSPATGLSNPNIQNPVCTLGTSNITYTVTTSGGCFTITTADDTVRLDVGPPPIAGVATANPSGLCSGQSSWIVLGGQSPGTIQWEVSTNGINWFNISGANNDSLNTGPVGSSLYYHAIVTGTGWPGSGCGSSTSPPVQVTVNTSPVADAGQNTSVCSGGCTNLTGTGGVTYTWMPGNLSGPNVNVCPPGNTTYTLYITDANGCSDSDMVSINISNPNVTASPSVSVCNGNSTILVASGPAGQTYSWLPNNTLTGANTANPTATPTATTTYSVTATNQFGCTATDSVLVQVTIAPPIVASNDTALCNGGSATLMVTGSASTTYSWSPGNMSGDSIVVSPVNTTTYVVTGNDNNCISYDTVIVNVAPPLAVYAGPDFDVCSGTQVTLNVGVSGGTYTWLPAGTILGSNTTQSVTAQPTSNTSYTVNVTDANGCVSADTITITVNPLPTVNATSTNNSICIGQTTSVSGSGASSYVWTPNVAVTSPTQATTNVNPSNTTTYMVTGTDANGCLGSDTITVFVNPLPVVYMTTNPTECGDTTGQIVLGGPIAGTPPFTYQIGPTTYTLPITGLNAGTYVVTITDANGCVGSSTQIVYTETTAFVNASANPTFGTYPLTVNFGASGSPGLTNYGWTFGDSNVGSGSAEANTYTAPGTYEVVVAAYNNDPSCVVYDTLYITVVEQATIALPNVFSPNNDAINDGFSATISGVQEIKIAMYSRWGNLIYESTVTGIAPNPQDIQLWDGKAKSGGIADDGVYYYEIVATGYDQKQYPMTGFVHLLTAGK